MAMTSEQIKNWWNGFSSYYVQTLEDPNLTSGMALSRMLKIYSAKTILEIGCGSDSLSLHLLQTLPPGVKYISVDLSDEMIKLAQEKKEKLKHNLNGIDHSFLVGDAEDLSFIPDESVDVVIAPLCYHIVTDPNRALKEAVRVLKKGGRIGFSVLGPHEKNTFFKILDDRILEIIKEMPNVRTVHHLGDREKLIQLAKDAGIVVDFVWEQDVVLEIIDENDLEKLTTIPGFVNFMQSQSQEVQQKIIEGIKKAYLETKSQLVPLKTNDLFLIGRKDILNV